MFKSDAGPEGRLDPKMSESTAAVNLPPQDTPAAPRRARGSRNDLYLYALLTAMVAGAWGFTRLGLYTSKSDVAYWMGVAGGVGMLLLLSYPMRKHLRFMRGMGKANHWFVGHMVLGVAGPMLILLHSTFQIGSLNAGVAFYSMVVVALSGVVGRFLYLRLHRNLNGQKLSLGQLRGMLDAEHTSAARLKFAPKVVDHCRRFEALALDRRKVTGAEILRAMLVLPWLRWRTAWVCRAELRRRLVALAHTEGWTRGQMNSRLRAARRLTNDYLAGVLRVALFAAWERLFSWWHIAHVPFVYILVISAVAHVVAVHAY